MTDKEVEKNRYDDRAKLLLSALISEASVNNFASISEDTKLPYLFFKCRLTKLIQDGDSILEIGSGTSFVTRWLVDSGAKIVATDISPTTVEYLSQVFGDNSQFKACEADMENLPFRGDSFDIVVSAGSLSYGDNKITKKEIYRVLKPGGSFICVDSLNHNPIFKLNRLLHFFRGNRTLNTLKRMPKVKLLESYKSDFGRAEIFFFGSLSWLFPLIRIMVGDNRSAKFSTWFDGFFKIRKSAFKFVMIATKCSGKDEWQS